MTTGTLSYSVIFTRYKNSRRVISGPVHIQATIFRSAFERATATLLGMALADPDSEFDIVAIECTAYNGEHADPAAPGLFDTDDSGE